MDSNAILKEKVENGLFKKLSHNFLDIQVIENEVTIKGALKNQYEKEKIERITKNTIGVISINNELAIN